MEVKLTKAERWIDKVKQNEDCRERNKGDDLPTYVYTIKKDGKIIGYRSQFIINGKTYSKRVTSKEYTLDQKLDIIKKWLNQNDPCKT